MKKINKYLVYLFVCLGLIGCFNNNKLEDGFRMSNSNKPLSNILCAYKLEKKNFSFDESIIFKVYLGYRQVFNEISILEGEVKIQIFDCDNAYNNQILIYEEIIEDFLLDEKNYLGYINKNQYIKYNFSTDITIQNNDLTRNEGKLRVCGTHYYLDDSTDGSCKLLKYEKNKNIIFKK